MNEPLAEAILRGAYDTLLKRGWIVARNTETKLLLERERRSVHVVLVSRLDNASLRKISRQTTAFSVVLAVHVEKPINLSLHVVVIDLLNSSQHGPPFPDAEYQELFSPFLGA